jgi:hypothetical protein
VSNGKEKNCNFEDKKNIIPIYAVSIVENTILTSEIESWHKFSDCLRRNNKELFEQMLQPATNIHRQLMPKEKITLQRHCL